MIVMIAVVASVVIVAVECCCCLLLSQGRTANMSIVYKRHCMMIAWLGFRGFGLDLLQ